MFINYSDDLKNEKIIGEITGTFHAYMKTQGRGGGHMEYAPFNLIFTENFIFGESLIQPPIISDDPLSRAFSAGHNFDSFASYLSEGKVMDGASVNIQGNMTLKLDYKKVKKIATQPFLPKKTFSSQVLANCIEMDIDVGVLNWLGGGEKFLFDQRLSSEALELLKKTPIADKIVSK